MVSVEIIWNYTDFDTIHDLNALPLIPLHTTNLLIGNMVRF